MYRSLTYLLKNGALPWADRSLTCQLKNRQVSSLTGLIAQIPCNSHHRVLTEEGPGFKVIKKLHWAVVGELPFLNRRWLLAGHLCHFSVPPDIPSLLPIIYVLFCLSKWQSFWVRDYNFLHMYTQSSGPNLRAPCSYSKSLCDRSVRGLRGLQGENRGIWSQQMWVCRRHWGSWECCLSQNWAPTPGKIRPHDTQLQISPGFCIPVCTIAATCSWVTKTFLSSFLPVSIFYSFYFCFLHMQAYRKFCPQLPSNQNFLFCIIDRKNSRYMDLFAGLPD